MERMEEVTVVGRPPVTFVWGTGPSGRTSGPAEGMAPSSSARLTGS